MSDFETGDTGSGDVEYGQYDAGQESGSLDQLHQAQGSEADHDSQYGVYEADHHAAESDQFATGHHVEYDAPATAHYEETDYTNASHTAEVDDHVFAAQGSEHAHEAQFSTLDALEEKFDRAFADGTTFSSEGTDGQAELGQASN
jgi:hypothetical protein